MSPRLIQLGKRWYLLGMNWCTADDHGITDLVDADVLKARPHWIKQRNNSDSVLGWVQVPAADAKKRLISYAAAVAAATDGAAIYVAQLDDTTAWYCMVNDGLVAADTDMVGSLGQVRDAARSLQSGLGYRVCVAGGHELEAAFPGATPFDTEMIVARIKRGALSRYSPRAGVAKALGSAVVLAGCATALWQMFGGSPEGGHDQAMLDRDSYLASARAQVDWPWQDSTWIDSAWTAANLVAPAEVGGWVRQQAMCSPARCVVSYQGSGARSLRGLQSRLSDVGTVQVRTPSEVALHVALPRDNAATTVTEDALLRPAGTAASAVETAANLIGQYADFAVDGAPAITPLGGGVPLPSDARAAAVAKFAMRGGAPDRARIVAAVSHFGRDGWVATGLAVRQSDFTVEFSRLEATH